MRIAITGASGFVGRQLVPRLLDAGASLLLVGRNPDTLRAIFPECEVIGYDDISVAAQGYDALLHLAVLNNNQLASYEAFQRVNVELALATCVQARKAGIERFIYVSSTHALDESNCTFYAQSKREAVQELQALANIEVLPLYLPAVVGDHFSSKLSFLSVLPAPLRQVPLSLLAALRPTIHIDRVAATIMALSKSAGILDNMLLVSDGQRENWAFRAFKRLQDLAFAIGIIFLLWWAMIIIWAVIRLQSPGPCIFRQQRVAKDERVFTCYKFRTMYASTPDVGTHEVALSSITPLGAFLRRTKLDELPQVLNILMNDMSLVGPRPCLPSQTALIEERRARGVFQIKPGITGLAQINNVDMSRPVRLAVWDRRYIQLQSIIMDIRIILATARGKGSGDRAKKA